MTREDFGVDLVEAILCCGAILQLRQMREQTPPSRIRDGQLTEWQQREGAVTAHLRAIVPRLSDADLADVMRRYPFMQEV